MQVTGRKEGRKEVIGRMEGRKEGKREGEWKSACLLYFIMCKDLSKGEK